MRVTRGGILILIAALCTGSGNRVSAQDAGVLSSAARGRTATAPGQTAVGQTVTGQASGEAAPKQAPDQGAPASGTGKVLFSRSSGDAAAPVVSPGTETVTSVVTDAMRAAPVFTSYDLDVHLAAAQASLSVLARVGIRNGGTEPLRVLPLQLSSALRVERVSVAGARLKFAQRMLASDADHTGQLNESVVELQQPLTPGSSLVLTVEYGGTIEPSAARLERLETPPEIAARSDWDRISEEFTGLRGFGDVVWYPVCSAPALLGDGVRLFAEIGRQRARNQDAAVTMRVTDEFTGAAPTVAVLDGHVLELGAPSVMPSASFPGVLRFELPSTRLGFRTPGLFLAGGAAATEAAADLRVYSTAHAANAQGYLTAAKLVDPLLSEWLGTRARERLALIDLPVEDAQPSEQGDAVLLSLEAAEPQKLAPLLSQELAHGYFRSPRPWLNEGVAALMGNLYAEQTEGREAALERLAAARGALALAEPASPGESGGQDLIHATDAIYYRAKALYVLWMLRDVAGDKALRAALEAYDAEADSRPGYFEKLLEQASGKDLKWFFDAWVYRDLGLPDLSIANVFSSHSTHLDEWLVAVDIANDGYAEVEVPVTVHSAGTAVTERVRVAGRSKVSHRMLIVGEPTSVEVNDGTVPEVQASVHQRLLQ